MAKNYFTAFTPAELEGITIPDRFTFPFFYQPHPLSELASKKLQEYLTHDFDRSHNFGLDPNQEGLVIGKMFGVLICQHPNGEVGYLWAFSGKLAGTNEHDRFVPPVFDMLAENSFFLKEVTFVNEVNAKVEAIEKEANYIRLQSLLKESQAQAKSEIELFKQTLKTNKAERKSIRQLQKSVLSADEYALLEADLIKQSLRDKHELNVLTLAWESKISDIQSQLQPYTSALEELFLSRKQMSSNLQQQIFEQYAFLNQYKTLKSLYDIFKDTAFGRPPAAAGECATPKLLQYAFAHDFKPLAMAEFWWGASPKSEVRKHGQFYPACTGKCEPILKHMLQDIPLEDNPFLTNFGAGKNLEIIYEDEYLVVVNKPYDLLSVPGINVVDSVYSRLKSKLQLEPLIIHRLDMPTSGLLVVAKTKEAHKHIQKQFLNRKVTKRYVALLSKEIDREEGEIDLPLRTDIEDRPRQLVCFDFGKRALTKFKVVSKEAGHTKIHFWPVTGRTHQLRMHSAHHLGLNAPIVGDDLYGQSADRLYLQAAYLSFTHPVTLQQMVFEAPEEF